MSPAWITKHLPLDNAGLVVIATDVEHAGDSITVLPETLASMTSSVPDVASHAALSALPIATDGAWQQYFDEWKAKGIIS